MNSRIYRAFAGTPGLLEHSCRVMFFTRQIIDYLPDGLVSVTQAQDLLFAAMYHDIGKATWTQQWFTLPRHSIRNVDWTVMQMHPIQSINILQESGVPLIDGVRQLILQHHERPGGNGYPHETDPEFHSLILAAADVFSACTENRAYRPYPMDHMQALKEVERFAPEIVVDVLKYVIKKIA